VCCAVLGRIGWAERAEVTVGARGCQFSLHLGGRRGRVYVWECKWTAKK